VANVTSDGNQLDRAKHPLDYLALMKAIHELNLFLH